MNRVILYILFVSLISCKTQKAVTVNQVENNSTTATQLSQQAQTTYNEVSTAKIIVNDISEMVTEVSVIDYDSIKFKPVKETKIRQTIKRNSGSVSKQQKEIKQEIDLHSISSEKSETKSKEIHKSKPGKKNNLLFIKFILGVTIGFLFADLLRNFPKRVQQLKKIFGFK